MKFPLVLRRRWEVVYTAPSFDGVIQHSRRYYYREKNAKRAALFIQALAPRGLFCYHVERPFMHEHEWYESSRTRRKKTLSCRTCPDTKAVYIR